MKPDEIRELSREELLQLLGELEEEHFNLRFQKSIKILPNPHRPRVIRKDIARIKTRLRELDLAEGQKRR